MPLTKYNSTLGYNGGNGDGDKWWQHWRSWRTIRVCINHESQTSVTFSCLSQHQCPVFNDQMFSTADQKCKMPGHTPIWHKSFVNWQCLVFNDQMFLYSWSKVQHARSYTNLTQNFGELDLPLPSHFPVKNFFLPTSLNMSFHIFNKSIFHDLFRPWPSQIPWIFQSLTLKSTISMTFPIHDIFSKFITVPVLDIS